MQSGVKYLSVACFNSETGTTEEFNVCVDANLSVSKIKKILQEVHPEFNDIQFGDASHPLRCDNLQRSDFLS